MIKKTDSRKTVRESRIDNNSRSGIFCLWLRLREGRVSVAYFPDQLHEILGVGGEDLVLVVNQGQGVHLLEVLDGEHVEPGAGAAQLVELGNARQVHGQAEAGRVVLGAEPVMDIGLGQLVHAVYGDSPPLQVALQHDAGVEIGFV